ncbi:MAG: hypothetical protein V1656_03175 [Candidatus Jorgensenbacteria bacterium]
MHNDIVSQLKILKTIAPEEGFGRRSRALILSHPAERPRLTPWFQLAGALAFAALILVLSPLFPSAQPVLSSSLDPARLTDEFNSFPVNIQLDEIRYQQGANLTVTSAMNEVTDTRTQHMNATTLNAEVPALPADEDQASNQINQLLDETIR